MGCRKQVLETPYFFECFEGCLEGLLYIFQMLLLHLVVPLKSGGEEQAELLLVLQKTAYKCFCTSFQTKGRMKLTKEE